MNNFISLYFLCSDIWMLNEYDRDYHKLWLSQTLHLWEGKMLLIFSCKFYFLFCSCLPLTKISLAQRCLCSHWSRESIWVFSDLLSRSLSLQPDSKYLKELECSRFFPQLFVWWQLSSPCLSAWLPCHLTEQRNDFPYSFKFPYPRASMVKC